MSMVTSLVVVAPDYWPDDRIARLGKTMYASQMRGYPLFDPDYGYAPIPLEIDDYHVTDGGKVPGGTIWWLGLKNNPDLLFEELDKVAEFHGVWIWVQSEDSDGPTTHLVGSKGGKR